MIRELTGEEMFYYCKNYTNLTLPLLPMSHVSLNFTENLYVRISTYGCYYFQQNNGRWSSFGMQVMADTNENFTHCQSKHLTQFAGGWVVLPSAINFEYVFANASFEKNITIYVTVIIITLIYFFLAIFSRIMDVRDKEKYRYCLMQDNNIRDEYFYEIVVFTGTRANSGTNSKVKLFRILRL